MEFLDEIKLLGEYDEEFEPEGLRLLDNIVVFLLNLIRL